MTDGNNPYAPPPPSGERPRNPTYNPYAPPSAQLGTGVGDVGDAEAVRREHLKHEASIRSVGCLFYWYGIFVMVAVGVMFVTLAFVTMISTDGERSDPIGIAGAIVIFFGVCAAFAALGYGINWCGKGLRKLEGKVRAAVTILAVIGLIVFPLGTLFGLYVLYLLHSEKGKRILTAEYRQAVVQTPHIKYRTPVWVWVVVLLIVGLLVIGIATGV